MIPAARVAAGAPSPMDEALRLSSIAEVVWIQADRLPDKIALVHGERALTYRSLQERCARFAAFVAARAGRGARVGILLPNLPELAVEDAAYRERVRSGKMKPERAAQKLAAFCPCGIFNHIRTAELLAENK